MNRDISNLQLIVILNTIAIILLAIGQIIGGLK